MSDSTFKVGLIQMRSGLDPQANLAAALALIDEAKRRSPGVVELEVNEANPRARRCYEREGFSVVGRGVSPHSGLPTLEMRWQAG